MRGSSCRCRLGRSAAGCGTGDPGAGAEGQDLLSVELAGVGEVDGLERGRIAQLGGVEARLRSERRAGVSPAGPERSALTRPPAATPLRHATQPPSESASPSAMRSASAGALWRCQAAGSMEANRRSRAWLRARAASLSLVAEAAASSSAKVVPGFRQAAALGNDLSFS